jgi:hypothetical protein
MTEVSDVNGSIPTKGAASDDCQRANEIADEGNKTEGPGHTSGGKGRDVPVNGKEGFTQAILGPGVPSSLGHHRLILRELVLSA